METFQDTLFPGVILENWQMMPWERIALTGVLARMRPRISLEIGVYYGGSLSLTSQFVEKIYAVDIDPAVKTRFECPRNAELIIGNSVEVVPSLLKQLDAAGEALEFVLVDADHSTAGVRRDLNLLLEYKPRKPMIILAHDSGNPDCREGIRTASWEKNEFVHHVDLDFIPGQIIEHTVTNKGAEVWGGFAVAYLSPEKRLGNIHVAESAFTSVKSIHRICKNIDLLK